MFRVFCLVLVLALGGLMIGCVHNNPLTVPQEETVKPVDNPDDGDIGNTVINTLKPGDSTNIYVGVDLGRISFKEARSLSKKVVFADTIDFAKEGGQNLVSIASDGSLIMTGKLAKSPYLAKTERTVVDRDKLVKWRLDSCWNMIVELRDSLSSSPIAVTLALDKQKKYNGTIRVPKRKYFITTYLQSAVSNPVLKGRLLDCPFFAFDTIDCRTAKLQDTLNLEFIENQNMNFWFKASDLDGSFNENGEYMILENFNSRNMDLALFKDGYLWHRLSVQDIKDPVCNFTVIDKNSDTVKMNYVYDINTVIGDGVVELFGKGMVIGSIDFEHQVPLKVNSIEIWQKGWLRINYNRVSSVFPGDSLTLTIVRQSDGVDIRPQGSLDWNAGFILWMPNSPLEVGQSYVVTVNKAMDEYRRLQTEPFTGTITP